MSGRTSETNGNVAGGIGSLQDDELKSHTHTYKRTTWTNRNICNSDCGNFGGSEGTQTSNSTGGSETRPKNIYVNFIIKY